MPASPFYARSPVPWPSALSALGKVPTGHLVRPKKPKPHLAENRRNCADTWLRGMAPVRKDTKQGP